MHRAGAEAPKEGWPLVLGFRETPYSLIHLENMRRLHYAGATILPLVPAFYIDGEDLGQFLDHYHPAGAGPVRDRGGRGAGVAVVRMNPTAQGKYDGAMKAAIQLGENLLREAERLAAGRGESLPTFIEGFCGEAISEDCREPIGFPTFRGNGLQTGVSLDESAALLELMDPSRAAD
jgi:hypothetical protein